MIKSIVDEEGRAFFSFKFECIHKKLKQIKKYIKKFAVFCFIPHILYFTGKFKIIFYSVYIQRLMFIMLC